MIDKKAFAVLGLALASLVIHPNAHASETDQATRLTFSESVQIPGRVLPAGTYWFVADRNTSNPKVVRVFSEDRSTCYATLQTISAEHLAPADETVITFADRASIQIFLNKFDMNFDALIAAIPMLASRMGFPVARAANRAVHFLPAPSDCVTRKVERD